MSNLLLQIENMLEEVVYEALKEEANEKGMQLQMSDRIGSDSRKLRSSDNDKKVDEAEEDEENEKSSADSGKSGGDMSKRPVEIPSELPANITVDMVITGIDAIRSARSLKKPEVREEFEEYFNSLSAPEKVGLLAYVYGIAETLIGSSEGRGLDPSEEPYNISMTADPEQGEAPSETPRQDAPTKSDSETPIVVGGQ